MVSAILSHIWHDYDTAGSKTEAGMLECMLLQCEDVNVAAMRIGKKHVAVTCGIGVKPSLLKTRLHKLNDLLRDTLLSLE